jgi:ribonucleoside-triphosphate reductase
MVSTKRTRCQVYSRVVGYMSPINQWNEGKKSEHIQRVNYIFPSVDEMDKVN